MFLSDYDLGLPTGSIDDLREPAQIESQITDQDHLSNYDLEPAVSSTKDMRRQAEMESKLTGQHHSQLDLHSTIVPAFPSGATGMADNPWRSGIANPPSLIVDRLKIRQDCPDLMPPYVTDTQTSSPKSEGMMYYPTYRQTARHYSLDNGLQMSALAETDMDLPMDISDGSEPGELKSDSSQRQQALNQMARSRTRVQAFTKGISTLNIHNDQDWESTAEERQANIAKMVPIALKLIETLPEEERHANIKGDLGLFKKVRGALKSVSSWYHINDYQIVLQRALSLFDSESENTPKLLPMIVETNDRMPSPEKSAVHEAEKSRKRKLTYEEDQAKLFARIKSYFQVRPTYKGPSFTVWHFGETRFVVLNDDLVYFNTVGIPGLNDVEDLYDEDGEYMDLRLRLISSWVSEPKPKSKTRTDCSNSMKSMVESASSRDMSIPPVQTRSEKAMDPGSDVSVEQLMIKQEADKKAREMDEKLDRDIRKSDNCDTYPGSDVDSDIDRIEWLKDVARPEIARKQAAYEEEMRTQTLPQHWSNYLSLEELDEMRAKEVALINEYARQEGLQVDLRIPDYLRAKHSRSRRILRGHSSAAKQVQDIQQSIEFEDLTWPRPNLRDSTPAYEDRSLSPSPATRSETEDYEMIDVEHTPLAKSRGECVARDFAHLMYSPAHESSPMQAYTAPETPLPEYRHLIPHPTLERSASPERIPAPPPIPDTPIKLEKRGRRKSEVLGSKIEKRSKSKGRNVTAKSVSPEKKQGATPRKPTAKLFKDKAGKVADAVAKIEASIAPAENILRRSARHNVQ